MQSLQLLLETVIHVDAYLWHYQIWVPSVYSGGKYLAHYGLVYAVVDSPKLFHAWLHRTGQRNGKHAGLRSITDEKLSVDQ